MSESLMHSPAPHTANVSSVAHGDTGDATNTSTVDQLHAVLEAHAAAAGTFCFDEEGRRPLGYLASVNQAQEQQVSKSTQRLPSCIPAPRGAVNTCQQCGDSIVEPIETALMGRASAARHALEDEVRRGVQRWAEQQLS